MSKQRATYQCTNRCDCLTIGEHYDAERKPGTRLVRMTSHSTGHVLSLYTWQIEQALLGGALKVVSDALRDGLHCAVADKILHQSERLQAVDTKRAQGFDNAELRVMSYMQTSPEWFPE